MIPIEDQYPSTEDYLPPMAGAQDDHVLAILEGGRERVAEHHTTRAYITPSGAVCPIGSILVADGMTLTEFSEDGLDITEVLETKISDAAKEAIVLLNKKSEEMFPESAGETGWTGPFEWVNQSWSPCDDPKRYSKYLATSESWGEVPIPQYERAAILDIYDAVIADRKGAPASAA
jgi:hypothetical protein